MILTREFVRQPNCNYLSVSKSSDTNDGVTEFTCSFHNWSKETVTLDSNGEIIERVNVFEDCFNCPDFTVFVPEEPEEPQYTPEEYFEFDAEIKTITRFYPTGINGDLDPIYDVVVPPQIGGVDVEEIGCYIEEDDSYYPVFSSINFEDIGVTSVIFPDTVTIIWDYAFSGCNSLTSVTLNDGLKKLGYCVFELCTSLSSITIPNSVTVLGEECFYDCSSLATISVGTGVTSILGYTFYNTIITDINLTNVVSLYLNAMAGCSLLEDVTIPNVTMLSPQIFYLCESLNSLTLGENVSYDAGMPTVPLPIWRTVMTNIYTQYKNAGYAPGKYTYSP